MSDALSTAASGLRAASSQFGTASSAVVRATTSDVPSDSAAPIVGMMQARVAFRADLAVIKVADSMSKSLLDIIS